MAKTIKLTPDEQALVNQFPPQAFGTIEDFNSKEDPGYAELWNYDTLADAANEQPYDEFFAVYKLVEVRRVSRRKVVSSVKVR